MHDQFVTPAQFCHWATQELLALTLFAARLGWSQNVQTTTLTVAGTEAGSFPLTVSPLCLVSVHQVRNGQVREIRYNNVVDFLRQTPGSTATGDPQEFRVLWDQDNDRLKLGFYPEPTVGSSILVSYIPEPKRLTFDASPSTGYANSISLPMGWHERVVLGVARRALIKEESDVTDISRMIADCDGMVEQMCWDRVIAQHPTVRNLSSYTGWASGVSYPPSTQWVWL